jgi:xanthosine utilization system XapX-like protein
MKMYLLSLCAGVPVGVIYSLMNVRSTAPPLVALVGPQHTGRRADCAGRQTDVSRQRLAVAWHQAKCPPHIFGMLPSRNTETAAITPTDIVEKHS